MSVLEQPAQPAVAPQGAMGMQLCQEATERAEVEWHRLCPEAEHVFEDDGPSPQLGDEDTRHVELGSQRMKWPALFEQAQRANLPNEVLNLKGMGRRFAEDRALEAPHQHRGRNTVAMNAE